MGARHRRGWGAHPGCGPQPGALIWATLWALMRRWPVSARMTIVVVAWLLLAAQLGNARARATVQDSAAIGLSAVVLSASMPSTGP